MLIRTNDRFLPAVFKDQACSQLKQARQRLQDIQNKTCKGAEWTGWYDWPESEGFKQVQTVKKTIEDIDVSYDIVVVLGIGGSYAGTRAVSEALTHAHSSLLTSAKKTGSKIPIVYAGQNLCEDSLLDLLDVLADKRPLLNVISKSGDTTETQVAFRVLKKFLCEKYGETEAAKRILVTTDPKKGSLRKLCEEKNYLSFPVPQNIGGRYSVLSYVGLLPLGLAGFDIEAMMEGSQALFSSLKLPSEEASLEELAANPVLYTACVRKVAWDLGKRIDVLAYSKPKLAFFVEWWKQLFGESEGKENKGLFPAGMLYSTDLHSLGQYVQEGYPSLVETFLRVEHPISDLSYGLERRLKIPEEGFLISQDAQGPKLDSRYISDLDTAVTRAAQKAHSDRGVPVFEIVIRQIDEFHLGALFSFFQSLCAVSAGLLDVNPFDQPGVEAYKRNLRSLLETKEVGNEF
ncbi:MAG: glucose-6-phosphate isomerase [Oligoflexales bacterium]|nr:glucose-6-phosphate isomerase [Oligoflexales bacterium]